MARVSIVFVLFNLSLFVAVVLAAPAEQPLQQRPVEEQKADLVAATDDLKPAASHWGGHWGGLGGYYGHGYGGYGGYGGYYPYYGSYWGYPSYGYGGYWPYGGYYGHQGYWW